MFAGGGTSQVAQVFSCTTGELIAEFSVGGHDGNAMINAVQFARTRTGPKLVVGDFSGVLSIFDIGMRLLVGSHKHSSAVVSLALPSTGGDAFNMTNSSKYDNDSR